MANITDLESYKFSRDLESKGRNYLKQYNAILKENYAKSKDLMLYPAITAIDLMLEKGSGGWFEAVKLQTDAEHDAFSINHRYFWAVPEWPIYTIRRYCGGPTQLRLNDDKPQLVEFLRDVCTEYKHTQVNTLWLNLGVCEGALRLNVPVVDFKRNGNRSCEFKLYYDDNADYIQITLDFDYIQKAENLLKRFQAMNQKLKVVTKPKVGYYNAYVGIAHTEGKQAVFNYLYNVFATRMGVIDCEIEGIEYTVSVAVDDTEPELTVVLCLTNDAPSPEGKYLKLRLTPKPDGTVKAIAWNTLPLPELLAMVFGILEQWEVKHGRDN